MPRPATNVFVSGLLLVIAALALLTSCGDNVYVVPVVHIPRGMRAITLTSDISVSPGDHVDVLAVGEGQEAKNVLENV